MSALILGLYYKKKGLQFEALSFCIWIVKLKQSNIDV